ncbi:hypothetical protein [Manganibacter manganicus]|uniref:DUF2946 domain-containing protein n=1 Tax=Manganibacter manganicus TaxID=1873176 RepID=A0A1V8RMU2_9HYPH|nr:hypothetical protein [Pseudaminobacter manganicus]OQM74525.1 hypothetical protein BFN67_21570 [Pseudaminobacter manganicus]
MRWSARHLLALLIAVSIAAGLGMSPVQATAMAVKMAMAADMGASRMGMTSDDGCSACPDQKSDNGKMTVCPLACVAPAVAVLPGGLGLATARPAPSPASLSTAFLRGRDADPDPYPPRPFSFV